MANTACAERGAQILGAPSQARQSRRRADVAVERKQRPGPLGADRQYPGVTGRNAAAVLEFVQLGRQSRRVVRAAGLGQHDAARRRRHHRLQVRKRLGGIDRVDPQPHVVTTVDVLAGKLARPRPVIGGDGVFQVDDHGIRTRIARFLQLALAVAGDKQEAADHFGFFSISATRLHSPTSSSCWL